MIVTVSKHDFLTLRTVSRLWVWNASLRCPPDSVMEKDNLTVKVYQGVPVDCLFPDLLVK